MKSAPHLIAGFTAAAALGAVVLLAAEDRALFEPQHAAMLLEVVDPAGPAWAPARLAPQRVVPAAREHEAARRDPARRGGSFGASSAP